MSSPCSYAHVPPTANESSASNDNDGNGVDGSAVVQTSKPPKWRVVAFATLLAADLLVALLLLFPLIPGLVRDIEGQSKSYQFHSSLIDLGGLAVARTALAVAAMAVSYFRGLGIRPEFETLDKHHPNGEKKTREELEREALEEPIGPWLRRFASRPGFSAEVASLAAQVYAVCKCLARMDVEIGILEDKDPKHPWFWIACLLTTLLSCAEATYLDDVCQVTGEYGKLRIAAQSASSSNLRRANSSSGLLRRIGSHLTVPLLSRQQSNDDEQQLDEDVEQGEGNEENGDGPGSARASPEDVRGVSDITGDSNYKATWKDLLATCYPDFHLICVAFVFLLLAAIAQVFIPKFLGKILDALTSAFANDSDDSRHKSMFEIPGFLDNVKLLVVASVLAGVFAGVRGSIFTVVGARVNVRLRIQLMDSLLAQDIGFFDVTKTGDITSRLSSDTTLVGDQVSLNVNVFLRSLVQAIGVLLFMFLVSWQLSILAFISVPLITLFSKWYGEYIRSLTKLMQKKLADGNSECEAALSSMATVRVFDAAEAELAEFEKCMKNYLQLNTRSAIAYFGYATFVTSLPQLVFAVVGTCRASVWLHCV
jgi:ABC transporter transmembrane region